MLLYIHKSKILQTAIKDSNLNFDQSITIDQNLMEATYPIEREKVWIVNNNGECVEICIMYATGSGVIGLNGAGARKAEFADIFNGITYAPITPKEAKNYQPATVLLNEFHNIV